MSEDKLNEKKDVVDKGEKVVKKDAPYYADAREKAMNDYLNDVGPISQYINEHMDQISKNHGGMEK